MNSQNKKGMHKDQKKIKPFLCRCSADIIDIHVKKSQQFLPL